MLYAERATRPSLLTVAEVSIKAVATQTSFSRGMNAIPRLRLTAF
jgi:hypothetical protein